MSIEIMPLAEMKQYQGSNPRPEPTPVHFRSALCFDLYFHGTDGALIHAKYIKPKNYEGKLPVIFLFHGYAGDSGGWWEKPAWVQQGFALSLVCAALVPEIRKAAANQCLQQLL